MVKFTASSLLLLVIAFGGVGCMKEERTVSVQELQWGEWGPNSHFFSLQTSSNSFPGNSKSATMLELKHHISPTSLKTHNLDHRFHENLLLSDKARASSLQSRIKSHISCSKQHQQSGAQIPLTSGATLQTLNYIINININGNNMPVIVDTGSELTWVQCKPCTYCYTQHNPLYDPSTSSTYHSIPCNSTFCTSLLPSIGTSGNCGLGKGSCNYSLRYGDGSYTRGELGQEKVGLGNTYLENFIFGCGRSNRGLFGGTSGLVGLGKTPLSLVSQTKAQFGGVFSYCLPSRVYNSSGNLVLGSDASIYKNVTPIAYTQMIEEPKQTPFYFINMTSVRVGGVDLAFSNGPVRVLIDSGTVITRLVPSMYEAVSNEFMKQFSEYPTTLAFSILDTCFDLSKYEEVKVPKLGLGFEGGIEVNVDLSGILYFAKKDASQVCLAMTRVEDLEGVGIIGNYQQKNQRVVYDIEGSRVGFGEERCSYS